MDSHGTNWHKRFPDMLLKFTTLYNAFQVLILVCCWYCISEQWTFFWWYVYFHVSIQCECFPFWMSLKAHVSKDRKSRLEALQCQNLWLRQRFRLKIRPPDTHTHTNPIYRSLPSSRYRNLTVSWDSFCLTHSLHTILHVEWLNFFMG